MSERHAADARSTMHIKNLLGRLKLTVINDDEAEFDFQFPVNDYAYLVRMLTTNP